MTIQKMLNTLLNNLTWTTKLSPPNKKISHTKIEITPKINQTLSRKYLNSKFVG